MQIGEPNCAQGYDIYNRHNNCPYSLLCATCDMDIEHIQTAEGCVISLNGQGHLPCTQHGRVTNDAEGDMK